MTGMCRFPIPSRARSSATTTSGRMRPLPAATRTKSIRLSGGAADPAVPSAPCRAVADHPYAVRGQYVGVEFPARFKQVHSPGDAPSRAIMSEHETDEWSSRWLSPLPVGRTSSAADSSPGTVHPDRGRCLDPGGV